MTRIPAFALVALLLAGCGGPAASPSGPGPEPGAMRVVATTTVLADLVASIGGTRVDVRSLVPKGGEVHTFDPSPSDVVGLTQAELIVANGLGLDEWLTRLAADAGATAPIVLLGEDLPGVDYLAGDEPDEPLNPHLWLDVANARAYVEKLAGALADADPEDAAAYRSAAIAYDRELAELDGWIRGRVETVPPDRRRLVSFHEAFPYLARAYGLEIVGVVVDAPGQDPSAGQVAALVDAIRAAGVGAVFGEAQFSDKLVRTIAEETGARVEVNLYNDSLGDPPADSYVRMMRWNVDRIVAALGGA